MANQWTSQNQKDWDAKQSEGQLQQEIEEAEKVKTGILNIILMIAASSDVTKFVSFGQAIELINEFTQAGELSEDCFISFLIDQEECEAITVNWEANSYRTIY